ncbi:uncharacterized protein LOC119680670 [Teleopsis dalmanni]|uniref:uncharacterized protein LOC119680670 n=1 Tax=Teleopsis dalmanni TaxID=139649 RepID=UPI0018CFDE17|nr:uncharacterized protein LOC119680670 [Teleopsis dalmanni]
MENITDIVNIDQTYQQPIQSSTNVSHETAIRNVLENAFNSQTEAYNDEKERIKVIIIEEITERKSNLLQVKNCIEREYEKSLSSIDNAYIEQKYMKYCTELWMEKVTALVQATTECNDTKLIQTILSSIDKIKTLSDIPESFKQLEYYKNLVDHYHFISENKKKNLISQFKEECLVPIFAYSATAQKESIFLEAFVDLLSSSRNIQSIINKLRLADFCMGIIYFDDLIDIILKYKGDNFNEKLTILQKASTELKNEENFFLLDKFKEVISGYIKPIKIEEKIIDNRQVIEVIRNNINITEILTQLEVLLKKKSSIEEVRFIGADVMHIGTNLDSEVWKGKNIIILTKALKIHNKVLWNVSGNNNLHFYKNNAGVTYNGTPGDGSDGYPGESGGNVLILVNKIENPENFTIISNGGNGSVGQDGGDGKNGVDGKGIINSDFCEKFPPVSKLFCYSRWKNVEKTINSIKSDLQEIKIGWYRDWTFCDPYTKNVFNDIHDAIIADGDIFLNTITEQGNEITFSYQAPNLFYNCQSFLLYKGSLGKPGSPGGRNGIGGQGGYPGDIIVRNVATNQQILVTTQSKEGTAGKNGKAGKYGNHGKNGWDMGYIDYSIGDKWPKIFGTDQNSKLMLKYHEDNSSERVHCPYKIDNYDKYSYVEITSSNIMDKKETKYEERNSDELNRNRQHHAQAVRKKNISQSNIEANYSVYCNNTTDKNSIKSMQLEIEKINQQIRQAMTENQEAQKNQTTESKIECKWKFIKQKDYNYKERKDLKRIIRSDRTDRKSIQDLLNEVKCPQSNFDNWFHLQDIEIKIDEINEFLSYFEIWKSEILKKGSKLTNTQNKLKEIELLLIDKYRFATLQVIAMQLVSHNKVKSKIELTAETVLKYLVKDKTKNNDISHSILGTLSQYLYEDKKEQREKIVNYCETDLLSCDENIQSFKRSIQVFILEERKSEVDFLDCLKKYFNEYTQFLEEKDHKFKTFFCAFKRELTKPLHRKVLDLWNRSIKDVSLKQELKNKIKNDKLLNALYIRFNKQLTLQYDWEKCCKDKDVLKEYYNYIRGKGPLSKSYRELLAHLFNVNIRLYISDIKYDLSLRDNHNPSSKIAIHAVQISNEFIQYSIDENYLKLVEEREYSNILFNNILRDLQSCNKKQDFDDYLKKKLFLKQNISLQNEKKVDSEETEVEKIMEFFSDQKEQQLKTRLEKIKSQYIDQQKILHYILKRFCTEGRNISYEEFSYLINSILNSVVEDRKELNIFCWITAAYNQRNWIDELLLLQLEDHFRSPLKEIRKWRKYLSKIENKYIVLSFGLKLSQGSKISYKFVGNTLRMLCNISTEKISLEGLELSDWHYTLKEEYWLSKLRRLTNWQKSDQLIIAAYYLLSVENSFGTDLTEKFLNIMEKKKQNLSSEELHNILSNFHNEKWILDKEGLRNLQSSNINEWSQFMQLKFINNSRERNFSDLVKIITSSANTSKKISKNLRAITDSNKNIYNENYIFNKKNVNCFTENDIKTWVKKNSGCNELNVTLLVINRAIQLKRGFKLRATQILTVLAFLTTDQSTLAQVSTGEGKTLIIVAISLIKLLRGEMVDIVTSSYVLAKRDSETNKDIYNLFGFDVSHNCSEDIEKRKEIYSCNQIVYGDLSNFQRDYLLDRFYGKNILGHHDFANIIVDEVDSMLLDKGNNMLYLTHDIADLDKLSSVFIYIWQWIKRPVKNSDDFISLFDTEAIKESVLNELYGYVKKEDIGNLGSDLH